MEAIVYNTDFNAVYVIDSFESFIWTDRYNKCGDFEIYCPAQKSYFDAIKTGYYLRLYGSDHMMIVESFKTQTTSDEGSKLIISGRSLESILDRRVIWTQTNINGNLQNGIKKLINDSIINPSDSSRKISNFVFEDSTDSEITSLSLSAQYTGDNLYDVVTEVCDSKDIGFRIFLSESNQFVFKLYKGVDRSYSQTANPYVVFSNNFDNIINSSYLEDSSTEKTIALIAGEGEGTDRKTATTGSGTGLNRKELFVDARNISSTTDGVTISTSEYNNKLIQRGKEKLNEDANKYTKVFDGEVDATRLFVYGKDFQIGDKVQLVTEFDVETAARVTEMIRSQNESGYSEYPSFGDFDV